MYHLFLVNTVTDLNIHIVCVHIFFFMKSKHFFSLFFLSEYPYKGIIISQIFRVLELCFIFVLNLSVCNTYTIYICKKIPLHSHTPLQQYRINRIYIEKNISLKLRSLLYEK